MSWTCPYCDKDLADERAACCGEVGHAVQRDVHRTTETISPCPFCASTAEMKPYGDGYMIECDKCHANLFQRPLHGSHLTCGNELKARWNTRSPHGARVESDDDVEIWPGCEANDTGYHRLDIDGQCSDCDEQVKPRPSPHEPRVSHYEARGSDPAYKGSALRECANCGRTELAHYPRGECPSGEPSAGAEGRSFQLRVLDWMKACFVRPDALDRHQRAFRFIEEALELVQAIGTSKEDVLRLVDYTYGRPPGEPAQEIGGVGLTLAAIATAEGLDQSVCEEQELTRCIANTEKIRAKDLAKPQRSPLPGFSGEPSVELPALCALVSRKVFNSANYGCTTLTWEEMRRIDDALAELQQLKSSTLLRVEGAEVRVTDVRLSGEPGALPGITRALSYAGGAKQYATKHCPDLVGDLDAIETALKTCLVPTKSEKL